MSRRNVEGRNDRRRDRAISEVLSYSLIFGLIVASIGIVTVGGLNSLQSAQTNEQLSNAERAFDVLHDNMGDIHAEGAPSRATEIALGDSQLFFDDNVTLAVNIDGGPTITREIRPLVYRVENERQLVYEAGATIRHERDGGIVLNEPPFAFREGPGGDVHIPIIRTTAPNVQSMGSTTVLVRGESWNREVLYRDLTGGSTLDYVQIESPRYEAWLDFFENRDYCGSVTEPSSGTARCSIDGNYETPDHLYVSVQAIDIDLIQ